MSRRSFFDVVTERAANAGITVTPGEAIKLERYWDLLARWNRKINLTAFALDLLPNEAVDRLILEPLVAATHVPASALTWFDIGSGGGSPAIPIKIAKPVAHLTLVEARAKKAAFLRETIRALELDQTSVATASFQELVSRKKVSRIADLITARGIRMPSLLAHSAAEALKPNGMLFLFGGEIAPDLPKHLFSTIDRFRLYPRTSVLYIFNLRL